MIITVIIVLGLLFILGFANVALLNELLIGNLTIYDILVVGILFYLFFYFDKSILKVLFVVSLIIYLLAMLGVLAIGGFLNIVLLATVITLVFYVLGLRFE